jgi:hypothetical protein
MDSMKRMNVSLTRARRHLVIIGLAVAVMMMTFVLVFGAYRVGIHHYL